MHGQVRLDPVSNIYRLLGALVVRGLRGLLVELRGNVRVARVGLVRVDGVAVLARIVPRVLLVLVGLREDAVVAVVAETLHATQHFAREGLAGLDVLVGTSFVIALACARRGVSEGRMYRGVRGCYWELWAIIVFCSVIDIN